MIFCAYLSVLDYWSFVLGGVHWLHIDTQEYSFLEFRLRLRYVSKSSYSFWLGGCTCKSSACSLILRHEFRHIILYVVNLMGFRLIKTSSTWWVATVLAVLSLIHSRLASWFVPGILAKAFLHLLENRVMVSQSWHKAFAYIPSNDQQQINLLDTW